MMMLVYFDPKIRKNINAFNNKRNIFLTNAYFLEIPIFFNKFEAKNLFWCFGILVLALKKKKAIFLKNEKIILKFFLKKIAYKLLGYYNLCKWKFLNSLDCQPLSIDLKLDLSIKNENLKKTFIGENLLILLSYKNIICRKQLNKFLVYFLRIMKKFKMLNYHKINYFFNIEDFFLLLKKNNLFVYNSNVLKILFFEDYNLSFSKQKKLIFSVLKKNKLYTYMNLVGKKNVEAFFISVKQFDLNSGLWGIYLQLAGFNPLYTSMNMLNQMEFFLKKFNYIYRSNFLPIFRYIVLFKKSFLYKFFNYEEGFLGSVKFFLDQLVVVKFIQIPRQLPIKYVKNPRFLIYKYFKFIDKDSFKNLIEKKLYLKIIYELYEYLSFLEIYWFHLLLKINETLRDLYYKKVFDIDFKVLPLMVLKKVNIDVQQQLLLKKKYIMLQRYNYMVFKHLNENFINKTFNIILKVLKNFKRVCLFFVFVFLSSHLFQIPFVKMFVIFIYLLMLLVCGLILLFFFKFFLLIFFSFFWYIILYIIVLLNQIRQYFKISKFDTIEKINNFSFLKNFILYYSLLYRKLFLYMETVLVPLFDAGPIQILMEKSSLRKKDLKFIFFFILFI